VMAVLYVVTEHNYDNSSVVGVFSSLPAARASLGDSCYVSPCVLDDPGAEPTYEGPWRVELAEGGKLVRGANTGDGVERDFIDSCTFEEPSAKLWWYPHEALSRFRDPPKNVPDKIATISVWATTRKGAIAAAKRYRGQMIEEGTWVWLPDKYAERQAAYRKRTGGVR